MRETCAPAPSQLTRKRSTASLSSPVCSCVWVRQFACVCGPLNAAPPCARPLNAPRQEGPQCVPRTPSAAVVSVRLLKMGDGNTTQSIADYLAQLLKDRKQLAAFPNVFIHVERLLDEEISKVRASLFQINGVKKEPLVLPDPDGPVTTLTEKVYVPVKEHPDFNFVGRILGPRGMTAKQLEQETGCKIMVRGKGSMRDKKKEDQNRGKPNWEHLSDELHVLLSVEDTDNRAQIKLARAVEEVKKLLVPQADGEDELKKRQLMELAIINGTYRDSTSKAVSATVCDDEWRRVAAAAAAETQRLLSPAIPGLPTTLRAPATPLGAPLILSPRMSVPTTAASILNGSAPPGSLLSPGDTHSLIYNPYPDYSNYAALASPLITEYATDHSGATAVAAKQRRHLGQIREHPYQRAGALS